MTKIFNKKTEITKRKFLRNNMPLQETILWSRLKNKQLGGYRFRRQFSIGRYVVDFYCPALKLVIEIDGDSHFVNDAEKYDKIRQNFIESLGIKFLRFTNLDIINNLNSVSEKILQTCHYPHLISPLIRGRKRGGIRDKFTFLFFIFSFLFFTSANAAELKLTSPISEVGVGQQFQVDLMIDAEGEDINAIEGNIIFPKNLLEIKEIYTGSSIINFWVEKPRINAEIKFSGIIPGGFKGVLSPYYQGVRPGKVLRLYFIAKTNGSAFIKLTDTKVLLNDGKGTEADLKISNFQFQIMLETELPTTSSKLQAPSSKDTESPEDFRPEIVNDPNLFNGKHTLVWNAKDKGSGIDHYEIAEERGSLTLNYAELPWQTAESPYVLKDQKLKSYIYVKAVDRAENIRIVYLPPSYIPWYKKPLVDIIGGLVLLIVLLLTARWLWRLLSKKH